MSDEPPDFIKNIMSGIVGDIEKNKPVSIPDHLGIKQKRFDELAREIYGTVIVDKELIALNTLFKDVKETETRARILLFARAIMMKYKDSDRHDK